MGGIFRHYPCNWEKKENCCWSAHLSWMVFNLTENATYAICLHPSCTSVGCSEVQPFTVLGKQAKMQENHLETGSLLSLNPLTKSQEMHQVSTLCITL